MSYAGQKFTVYGTTIKQVTKKVAERLFNQGKKVYLLADKCRPDTTFFGVNLISPAKGDSFEAIVNEFHYYNCNREAGYNIQYFAECE